MTSVEIRVYAVDDNLVEPDETFQLTLTGFWIADGQGGYVEQNDNLNQSVSGSIIDDNDAYTAAIGDVSLKNQTTFTENKNVGGCGCQDVISVTQVGKIVLSFQVNITADPGASDDVTLTGTFGDQSFTATQSFHKTDDSSDPIVLEFNFDFDAETIHSDPEGYEDKSAKYAISVTGTTHGDPPIKRMTNAPVTKSGKIYYGKNEAKVSSTPKLETGPDGLLLVSSNKGYFFDNDGLGGYVTPEGSFGGLTAISGGYQYVDDNNTVYVFDGDGYILTETDSKGRVTTYYYITYNGKKLVSTIERPFMTTSFSYTGDKVTNASTSTGDWLSLSYTGNLLTSITEADPDGTAGPLPAPVTTYGYDAYDRLTTKTVNGLTTTYTYDSTGRLASVESPDGSIVDYVSAQQSAVSTGTALETVTNEEGISVKYGYDSFGNITREEDALGNVTIYERDANGLLLKKTLPDPDGTGGPLESPVYEYTYDSRGNMLTETLPDLSVRTWVYHTTWNQPIKYTDAEGHITTYTYDSTYELMLTETKVIGQIDDGINLETDDQTTTYTYTSAPTLSTDPPRGLVESVTTPDGIVTEYEYNAMGLRTETTYAVGTSDEASTSSTYSTEGWLLTRTDELGNTTTYTYDDIGRQLTMTTEDPDGAGSLNETVTTYTYNPQGLKKTEDVNGRTTTYTYDTYGRLTKITEEDPDGAGSLTEPETTYTYDSDGNVLTTTDPLGNVTTNVYTDGLLTSVTSPDPDGSGEPLAAPVTSYTYDAMGRVLTMTNPLGNVTTYAYDNLGRRISVTMPDPDGAGSLVSLVSTTAYDSLNRVISQTNFDGTTTTYTYDSEGNKLTETTALGTTTYEYDELNRLVEVETADPDGTGTLTALVTTYAYTVGGQMASMTTSKGTTTYTYDNRRRRTSTTLPDPDGAGDQTAPVTSTTYDAAGNVLAETDALGYITQYEYDALNRVIRTTTGVSSDIIDFDDYTIGSYAPGETSPGATYSVEDDGATLELNGNIWRHIDFPYTVTADTVLEFDYESDAEGEIQGIGLNPTLTLGNWTFIQVYGTQPWGNPSFDDDYDPGTSTVKHYRISLGSSFIGSYNYMVFANDHDAAPQDSNSIFSNIKIYEANTVTYEYDEFGQLVAQTDPNHGTTAYEYDNLGRRTKIIYADPDKTGGLTSPEVSYAYDAAGQMTEMTDELGQTTVYEYDNLGRQISVTLPDPDGAGAATSPVTTYSYDAASQLLSVTDPLSRTTSYTYDSMGRRLTETLPDPDGAGTQTAPVTTYTYNTQGQLESVTDAASQTVSYTYNSAGLTATMTDPRGTTVYAYDALGRQIAMFEPDPDGAGAQLAPVTLTQYNDDGEVASVTTRDGKTSYTYDNLGRVVTVTQVDPDDVGLGVGSGIGSGTGATGSASGGPEIVVTDGVLLGQVLTDGSSTVSFGTVDVGHSAIRTFEITNIGDSLLSISSFALPSDFKIISYSDAEIAAGESTTITIQFTPTSVASYSVALTIYNDDSDESSFEVQLTGTGQASTNGSELAASMTYAYDAVGRTTSQTDALGNATSYEYDNLGRLVKKTDAEEGETTYTYDANGNRLTLTDPEDNTTTWTYDALNRMVTDTNELGDTRTYTYNAAGNQTGYLDRNGRDTRYYYDNLQRLTTEIWREGGIVVRSLNYAYDAASQLTSASDPAATYTFTYDNLGRNTSTEHDLAALGFDVVVDETYDALGRRTGLAAEIDGTDDLVNSYAYDYLNRMTQVTQGSQAGGNVVAEKRANFSYDAEDKGQFTSISRYADLAGSELVATSTYGYDAADRITSLTHADSSSSTLAGYTWGYDEGNRLTDFTVAGYSAEDATYTYDDTDQLTGADRSGTTSDESYTYDENGNRTGGSYSTGDNNQILSDGTYNYTYDDEGNRLTKTNISTGEVIEYTWDNRSRLVNITTKTSGGTITHEVDYTYDIFNRRIGKTIDADGDGAGTATEEIYIYDGLREEQGNAGDHILLAFDESDDLTDRFLYGPNVDQVLASEEVTSTASAGDVLWALTDHLGTVRDVVDYNAGTNTTTVQNHLTYDAFGNITAETNAAVDFLFAFTGRERDEESDLQYNRARYYDAAIGKWVAEDPIGFAGGDSNLSRYVNNQTPSSLDPSGFIDTTPLHITFGFKDYKLEYVDFQLSMTDFANRNWKSPLFFTKADGTVVEEYGLASHEITSETDVRFSYGYDKDLGCRTVEVSSVYLNYTAHLKTRVVNWTNAPKQYRQTFKQFQDAVIEHEKGHHFQNRHLVSTMNQELKKLNIKLNTYGPQPFRSESERQLLETRLRKLYEQEAKYAAETELAYSHEVPYKNANGEEETLKIDTTDLMEQFRWRSYVLQYKYHEDVGDSIDIYKFFEEEEEKKKAGGLR
ncbi:RHS repeat-associated core domain-containing protein [Blastopirellula marina]|uniref:RHS repeat-associated core domain-containing protein n=1 Tax=Blastopirellula marina TaxID=124 RepID=UPI001304CD01|nr:RHS repeat-associated core domain-containing protein [Blastopirellula marina]